MTRDLAAFFRAQKEIRATFNENPLFAPFPPDIVKEEAVLFGQLCDEKWLEEQRAMLERVLKRKQAVLDWVLEGDPDPAPAPISGHTRTYLSYWWCRLRKSLRHLAFKA